ncbi:MAG: sulfatase-like hydrolase/transferase [Planctomycetota bacterium]
MARQAALAALALLPFHPPPPPTAPQAPTRVLVVDLDDVGYDLLADTPTTTLDWIAAHGRMFTSFVTAPQCTPTRAMMHLGAYPSHPDVLMGGALLATSSFEMPTAPLVPLGTLVASAGRTTAKVGKWHLGSRTSLDHPGRCGWQHYAGVISNLDGPDERYRRFLKVVNGTTLGVVDRYLTTDETDDAIACVRAEYDLVSLSYHAPHRPWHDPPAHLHSVSPLLGNRDRARAMLQACDRELGRLLREALPRGYTVLVFCDNGTAMPIGGEKGTVREGGVVVPLWAIGPGVAPGVDDARIGAVDLYATIAELLGVPAGGATRGPHSASFARALAGGPLERRWAYTEKFQLTGQDPRTSGATWVRAVRGERYKLHASGVAPQFAMALYDLANDPAEANDLLAAPSLEPAAQAALDHFRAVMRRL